MNFYRELQDLIDRARRAGIERTDIVADLSLTAQALVEGASADDTADEKPPQPLTDQPDKSER